jgi:hypothetical protein
MTPGPTIVVDIPLPPLLLPLELWTGFRHIGTGLHDTMAPTAITWTPIYGRLGTRRLGTVFLCISLWTDLARGSWSVLFGFPLARLKWSYLLESVRLPLQLGYD